MKARVVWIFGVLAILALVLAACAGRAATPQPTPVPPTLAPTAEMEEEPSVTVRDQDAGEGTVIIEDVHATQAGWIVIHVSKDGSPGPVIGFAAVQPGENHDVEVSIDLEKATLELFAMLHVDAGAVGTYEFPGEDGPARAGDSVVNVPFKVTFPIEADVRVSDQDASGGTVMIEKAAMADPGWLVIHAAKNGGPGPVIGYAPLAAGNNLDVSVEIDLSQATRMLFAMLHLDAGTMGSYDFPGEDGPVRAAEKVVVRPFTAEFPVEAAISVQDQDYSSGMVVIDKVSAADQAWVVIHIDNGGAPGAVIGFAQVPAGNNLELEVEIDAAAATPRLFAMLHTDAGTLGEYEFPGDDVPVRVGDAVVVVPFNSKEAAASGGSGEVVVLVVDSSYEKKEITVPVGTTVIWRWEASFPHTVTADDRSFDSGVLRGNASFSFTFDRAGSYPYYCTLHGSPGGGGMAGKVIVTDS